MISDGSIDWPAWVQAVGSVLAILVSVALSFWVPLHMRNLQEREDAHRALRFAQLACDAMTDYDHVVPKNLEERGNVPDPVLALLQGETGTARKYLEQATADRFDGGGVAALAAVGAAIAAIEGALVAVNAGKAEPSIAAKAVRMAARRLSGASRALTRMHVQRSEGRWRAVSPADLEGPPYRF